MRHNKLSRRITVTCWACAGLSAEATAECGVCNGSVLVNMHRGDLIRLITENKRRENEIVSDGLRAPEAAKPSLRKLWRKVRAETAHMEAELDLHSR